MATPASQALRRLLSPGPCSSCSRLVARDAPLRTARAPRGGIRFTSSTPRRSETAADGFARLRAENSRKNTTTVYYGLSAVLVVLSLAYGSVPFYKMVCQKVGWGGSPVVKGKNLADEERLTPVANGPKLRITFQGATSSILPWKFVPQQREVRVLPGETALAFYTATNLSDTDIIGVATYSINPGQASPYFSKIQCFCFEEQRLNAGETVDMPVFFYIDPDFVNDINMRNITELTLNYCFFKARYDSNGKLAPVAATA